MRQGLAPGVNVDRLDIAAGMTKAAELGYTRPTDRMITEYALQRHRRGEEEGAKRTWLGYYPRDLTSFTIILAHAITSAQEERRNAL